jgi:hypothetical protein
MEIVDVNGDWYYISPQDGILYKQAIRPPLSLIWIARIGRAAISLFYRKKVVGGRTKSGHDTAQRCANPSADRYYSRGH